MTNSRDEAIASICKALKVRSGKAWSVTGGRGTSWGWLRIDAAPARKVGYGMTDADKAELADLLDLEVSQVSGGVSIPASDEYRMEYVARAQGVTSIRQGQVYWD